jgi:hypothetical protein
MTTPFDEFESEIHEIGASIWKLLQERKTHPPHIALCACERVMIRLAKLILETDNEALAHEWIVENMQRRVDHWQRLNP